MSMKRWPSEVHSALVLLFEFFYNVYVLELAGHDALGHIDEAAGAQ
jgi:hypothetical protein